MRTSRVLGAAICCVVMVTSTTSHAGAADTSFTYQGQLKVEGVPLDGRPRCVFSLWDAPTRGLELGRRVTLDVDMVDGLFAVPLDFGPGVFTGERRFLEISVDTGRGPILLTPRQEVTPAPYAMLAQIAEATVGVDGHSLDSSDGRIVDALMVDPAGNVGIGTDVPGERLDVAGTVAMDGLRLGDAATVGHVLTSNALGIGTWQAPPAGGDSLWGQVRSDIFYDAGNVGIGTRSPTAALDIVGNASMDGFQLRTLRVPAGHVLTTDANGVGTWQAPPQAADPVWGVAGADVYYDSGQVGIGTNSPQHPLHVTGSESAIIRAENTATLGDFAAVLAHIDSTSGKAVKGVANATTGVATGVYGQSFSAAGMGVHGRNLVGGYGVYGEGQSSTTGWAGYFFGRGYFSGNVGIGRSDPQAKLDVNGTVKMNGLQLGTSTTAGYVLTASSGGVATWQAPAGGGSFTLPVDETVDVDGASALSITNTGTGSSTVAIRAIINNSLSENTSAGSFRAFGSGTAINATSDGGTAVYASGDGIAVYGSTTGTGGGSFRSTQAGGFGVKGIATNTAGDPDTIGGWFESASATGKAVYAKATGAQAIGLKVETTGAESYAIDASSPYYGLYASGGVTAARFYGNVSVKSRTSGGVVFTVANDGVTTVDVLQILGGADLSEQFDVSDDASSEPTPGMVVCIDPDNPGKLAVCGRQYDRRVAGIISGAGGVKTGMMMGQTATLADGAYPVALTGRVYVWGDTAQGPIEAGDLLTTSDVPGHAMRITDFDRSHGATLGKAMTSLTSGRGLVLVLVSLQ